MDAPRRLSKPVLVLAVLALWVALYALVSRTVDPARARTLGTPLDAAIPFWPASVFLYSWAYTSSLYPVFVVRSPGLFRRVALAYVAVTVVSMACFVAFPVTAVGLRPPLSSLDRTHFAPWGVRLTYLMDPPYNLFPSMHLSIALLAALSAWRARRLFGALAFPMVAAIAVSICTMKQHFVADGLAAVPLAAGAYLLIVRPYRPTPAEARDGLAYSWRGPVGYLAFHFAVYGAFWAAFRLGLPPYSP